MTRIAITADTTCSIQKEEAKQLGVFTLPLNVIVNEVEYHDGVDINNDELCAMMRNKGMIKTSTPTFKELEDFFDGVFAQGYDKIIHFTISSKLSSIFSMFTLACEERYGDKVVVIDSMLVCSFMGNLVKHAVNLNNEGVEFEKIVESCKERVGAAEIYFMPESLEYLKRGGRVSPAVAAIGGLLGIKPVLSFQEGAIEKFGTTRSVKQILPKLIEIVKENNYSPDRHEIHIVEFDSALSTKILVDTLSKEFPEFEIKVTPISINVCGHCGPGTCGFGFTLKP